MKKIISAIIATAMMFTLCVTSTFAAESWREAFVTRLMKIMSSDPSYNQVVLTDLDRNGIPEAFVMRDGMDGGISAAFTMKGNTISNIDVPNNIIGTCLSDITVYQDGGRYIFVGREVPRYSSVINFYKLMFDGQTFSTEKILKSYVSSYQTVPYVDMYGNDLPPLNDDDLPFCPVCKSAFLHLIALFSSIFSNLFFLPFFRPGNAQKFSLVLILYHTFLKFSLFHYNYLYKFYFL